MNAIKIFILISLNISFWIILVGINIISISQQWICQKQYIGEKWRYVTLDESVTGTIDCPVGKPFLMTLDLSNELSGQPLTWQITDPTQQVVRQIDFSSQNINTRQNLKFKFEPLPGDQRWTYHLTTPNQLSAVQVNQDQYGNPVSIVYAKVSTQTVMAETASFVIQQASADSIFMIIYLLLISGLPLIALSLYLRTNSK